jgi:hypothetical protein
VRLRSVGIEDAPTTALAKDATTFALAAAAPDPVVHVILEGVLQALTGDRATGTDALGDDYSDTVTGKERPRWVFAALTICHPLCTHAHPPKVDLLCHSSDCLCDKTITAGSFVHEPLVTILL